MATGAADTKAMPSVTHVEATEPSRLGNENTYLEDDPHRAALEDNPDKPERLSWSVCLSVLFLALAFVPSLTSGFVSILLVTESCHPKA